jgi:hypothetical protein
VAPTKERGKSGSGYSFNFETINNRQCVSEYLKRTQLEGCIATSLVYFG